MAPTEKTGDRENLYHEGLASMVGFLGKAH